MVLWFSASSRPSYRNGPQRNCIWFQCFSSDYTVVVLLCGLSKYEKAQCGLAGAWFLRRALSGPGNKSLRIGIPLRPWPPGAQRA